MPASIKEIFQSETWNAACQIKEGATMDNGVPSVCRSGDRPAGCWSRLWAGLKRILSEEIRRENKAGIVAYCKQLQAVNDEMGQQAEALLRHRWYYGQPITLRKVKEIAVQHFCNEDFISNFIMQPNLQNGVYTESGCQKIEEALEILKLHLGPAPGENEQARSEEERNALVLLEGKIAQNQQKKSTLREASGSLLTPSGEKSFLYPSLQGHKTLCSQPIPIPKSTVELWNASVSLFGEGATDRALFSQAECTIEKKIHHPLATLNIGKLEQAVKALLDESIDEFQSEVKAYQMQNSQVQDYIMQLKTLIEDPNSKKHTIQGIIENLEKVSQEMNKTRRSCIDKLSIIRGYAKSIAGKLSSSLGTSPDKKPQGAHQLIEDYTHAVLLANMRQDESLSDSDREFLRDFQKKLNAKGAPQSLRGQIIQFFLAVDSLEIRCGDLRSILNAKYSFDEIKSQAKQKLLTLNDDDQVFQYMVFADSESLSHPFARLSLPTRVANAVKKLLYQLNRHTQITKTMRLRLSFKSESDLLFLTTLDDQSRRQVYREAHDSELKYQKEYEGAFRNAIQEMKDATIEAEKNGSLKEKALEKCKFFLRALELTDLYVKKTIQYQRTHWDLIKNIDNADRDTMKHIDESLDGSRMKDCIMPYWNLQVARHKNKEFISMVHEICGIDTEFLMEQDPRSKDVSSATF